MLKILNTVEFCCNDYSFNRVETTSICKEMYGFYRESNKTRVERAAIFIIFNKKNVVCHMKVI